MNFKEAFLHFIWINHFFQKNDLVGSKGEKIEILQTGLHNQNSGPDFFNAQIKIDGLLWAGNIEIHVKSSDWFVHHHETDKAYDSVILHVVWEDNVPVFNASDRPITTLVLKNYINNALLQNYYQLFLAPKKWINCENKITTIDSFIFHNYKERLYLDRVEKKVLFIENLLEKSNNNWEAVLFKLLTKNFGLKVNGEAFLQIANAIPFNLVRKTSQNLLQLEALFFGVSNLLDTEINTKYHQNLVKEYQFIKNKFALQKVPYNIYPKFFRLRPPNFPTIRLAQLANLYHHNTNLFSNLMQTNTLLDFYSFLSVGVSSFWETHYTFDSISKKNQKKLTKNFMDLLLINSIIPLQIAYQKHKGIFKAENFIQLIQSLKPEQNNILEKFNAIDIEVKNAMDSQALIHLYTNYCTKNECLKCTVGNQLLKM
ncbi:MAG TPA: DUF2851 family protein [Flavobacteriia bacterium]|nr:DUF2851 family protein [Flavobacteriia bacterium]